MSKSASNLRANALRNVSRGLAAAALCLCGTAIANAGSIWPSDAARERSMVADKRAAGVGDILTIVVNENAVAQSSQSKKSNRDSAIDDAVEQFFYANSKALTHNGGLPALKLSGSASYSGGGDVSNTQSLSTRAAVVVTDVLPNGNFVIEGTRIVTFSGETQHVVLRGIVRADDVSRDNTVASSDVADARVEFYSQGQLSDAQKRGWFARLYEKLRPF